MTLREALDAHEFHGGIVTAFCTCGWKRLVGFEPWADHREQAIRAALASERSLDDAWRDAEAALPEGWRMYDLLNEGRLLGNPKDRWNVVACEDATSYARGGTGPTPIAALDALTAKLRTGGGA